MDYTERLRRLAINDETLAEEDLSLLDVRRDDLEVDQKSLALAKVAALVAIGGAAPSFGAQVDTAIGAGATAVEIVDILAGIVPVVGVPRAVAAAPKIALALGHDLYDADTGQIVDIARR